MVACATEGRGVLHYSIQKLGPPDEARETLKSIFPTGAEADEMNLVLFSTSGVHGTYTTIEDIEESFKKYGDTVEGGRPDDHSGDVLTVALLHPRLVCLRYGNMRVRPEDIEWLKTLRAKSREAFSLIGGNAP